jgi:hypothetical protein
MVEVYNTNIVFSNFSEFERKLFLKAQTFGLELNTNSKKIENININVDIHFIDIFKNTDCITGYNLYIGKEGFFHLIKIIEIEKQLFNSCQPFSKLICFIKANLEYDFETYKKQIDSFYMLHNNSFRIQNSEQLIKHTNKLFNNYFSETEVCEYLNIYFGNNLNWYIFRNLSFLVCGASNSELEEFFEKPTYWKSPLFPFYLTIYQHNMITMMKRRIITALDMFLNKKISEFMDFSIPEEKYISIYPNKDGKGCNLDILTMDFTQCSDKSDVVTKNTILNSASNIFDLNTNITRPKKVGCSSVRNIMLAMFSNTVGLKQKIINCLKKIIIDAYYFEYSSKRLKIDIEYGLEKEYIFLKSLTHSYISEKFGLRSDYSGTCALILFMTFLIFCVIEETHDNPTYDCNYDRGLFITRLLNDYYQYQSNYNYKKFSIIHVYNVFKSYDSYLSKNEDAYNYYFHLFIDTELKFTKFNNKHMYFSLEDFNKIKDTISQTISENSGDFDNNLNLIANKSSNSSNNSSPKKDELNSGGVYSDVSKMVSMSSNHMVNDSIMSVDSD